MLQSRARKFVNRTLNLPLSNNKFPGTLPVSMERHHLDLVMGRSQQFSMYTCSHKVDGERVFVGFVATKSDRIAFSVDRRFVFSPLKVDAIPDALFAGTLFDAELVTKGDRVYFVIFDCMSIHGHRVVGKNYLDRMELARMCVERLSPSSPLPVSYPQYQVPSKSTSNGTAAKINTNTWLCTKPLYRSVSACHLKLDLNFCTDGLVFTDCFQPYSTFRSIITSVFKWKPVHLCTLDFVIASRHTTYNHCSVPQWVQPFQCMYGDALLLTSCDRHLVVFSHVDVKDVDVVLGAVYECVFDHGKWRAIKARTDKCDPNSLETVVRTLKSIKDGIRQEDLS